MTGCAEHLCNDKFLGRMRRKTHFTQSRSRFYWATVISNGSPYAIRDRCPVGLSVTLGVLWPNGWMDQDATWCSRPRPRQHCVRWGPSSPTERGTAAPHFSAHVCCGQSPPNGRSSQQLLSSCCLCCKVNVCLLYTSPSPRDS